MWVPPSPSVPTKSSQQRQARTQSWSSYLSSLADPRYISTWTLWLQQGLVNAYHLGRGGLNSKRYYIWKREQARIQQKLWTDPEGYWFCNIVVVTPEYQGKGVGGRLMGDVLGRADKEGRKCYLESSRAVPNVGIYERWGFQLVGEMDVEDEGEACKVCRPGLLLRHLIRVLWDC